MSKRKHTPEWRLERIEEYLSGRGSYRAIAEANGISARTLRQWVKKHLEKGEAAFVTQTGNAHYSRKFRMQCA